MLSLRYIETPYVVTYRLEFTGDAIVIEHKMNVSLTKEDYVAAGVMELPLPY